MAFMTENPFMTNPALLTPQQYVARNRDLELSRVRKYLDEKPPDWRDQSPYTSVSRDEFMRAATAMQQYVYYQGTPVYFDSTMTTTATEEPKPKRKPKRKPKPVDQEWLDAEKSGFVLVLVIEETQKAIAAGEWEYA